MTLSADVKAFITDHQPHGQPTGDADEPTPTGYRLWITCPCGATFERWVTLEDAAEDLAMLAPELTRHWEPTWTHAGARSTPRLDSVSSPSRRSFPRSPRSRRGCRRGEASANVVVGMERQGFALSLRKLVDDGWNAAFEENRLLAPAGRANAPTPFEAVQRAAWQALNHKPMGSPGVAESVEQNVL